VHSDGSQSRSAGCSSVTLARKPDCALVCTAERNPQYLPNSRFVCLGYLPIYIPFKNTHNFNLRTFKDWGLRIVRFTVVTYGSEGDTRSLVALCRGLMDAGHQVLLFAEQSTLGSAHAQGVRLRRSKITWR
jgi:hypothetical protein